MPRFPGENSGDKSADPIQKLYIDQWIQNFSPASGAEKSKSFFCRIRSRAIANRQRSLSAGLPPRWKPAAHSIHLAGTMDIRGVQTQCRNAILQAKLGLVAAAAAIRAGPFLMNPNGAEYAYSNEVLAVVPKP